MIQNMQSHPPTSVGSGGLPSLEAEMLLSGRKEKGALIGYVYNLTYWNCLFFLKASPLQDEKQGVYLKEEQP